MKVVNEDLLDEFRAPGRCEWCTDYCPDGRDPHHLWARGMGGGGRLDIRENLISLCRVCHSLFHAGHIGRYDLLAIVAHREGKQQYQIEHAVYAARRAMK